MELIKIRDLNLRFKTYAGHVQALKDVSFDIFPGERVALVGESGCGKSATAHTIMGMLPEESALLEAGCLEFEGQDLCTLSTTEWRKLHQGGLSMIFQDPLTSLNPTMRVGKQITEGLPGGRDLAVQLMREVGIPAAEHRVDDYPHALSGGMRQRIMIALALASNPRLLIADEPTTALDVTIQAQILELLEDIQKKNGMSILLITHDLGIVASFCQRVIVMYAGQVVEQGSVQDIFKRPQHPYTRALLKAVPRMDQKELFVLEGRPPNLLCPPKGCHFAPRCTAAMQICQEETPQLFGNSKCWLHDPRCPPKHKEAHLAL